MRSLKPNVRPKSRMTLYAYHLFYWRTAFKLMEIDLPLDASIYGDKAYIQYSLEDDLQEFEKIRWVADRKTKATWARI